MHKSHMYLKVLEQWWLKKKILQKQVISCSGRTLLEPLLLRMYNENIVINLYDCCKERSNCRTLSHKVSHHFSVAYRGHTDEPVSWVRLDQRRTETAVVSRPKQKLSRLPRWPLAVCCVCWQQNHIVYRMLMDHKMLWKDRADTVLLKVHRSEV